MNDGQAHNGTGTTRQWRETRVARRGVNSFHGRILSESLVVSSFPVQKFLGDLGQCERVPSKHEFGGSLKASRIYPTMRMMIDDHHHPVFPNRCRTGGRNKFNDRGTTFKSCRTLASYVNPLLHPGPLLGRFYKLPTSITIASQDIEEK